jgi:phage terminase small subunit
MEYVKLNEGKKAAINAGYSPKTAEAQASRMLRIVKVQEEIKILQKPILEKLGIDAEWVLVNLKEVAERCKQDQAVLDSTGKPIGEYRFDSGGANKALELIGKHLKMFTDNIDVNLNADKALKKLAEQLSPLPKETLEKIAFGNDDGQSSTQ